jgi:hypothetical protein
MHPSAIDGIVQRILPDLESREIKVIFATHSMPLALYSKKLKFAERTTYGNVEVIDSSQKKLLEGNVAHELGFTRADVLASIKRIIASIILSKKTKPIPVMYSGSSGSKFR